MVLYLLKNDNYTMAQQRMTARNKTRLPSVIQGVEKKEQFTTIRRKIIKYRLTPPQNSDVKILASKAEWLRDITICINFLILNVREITNIQGCNRHMCASDRRTCYHFNRSAMKKKQNDVITNKTNINKHI